MSAPQPSPLDALPARIRAKIAAPDANGCCLWTGYIQSNGYGKTKYEKRDWLVHRLVYTLLVGPIPEGLTIDHVKARGCTSKACCWPGHLEPVTNAENVRRGDAGRPQRERTHCPQGHPYDAANTFVRGDGARQCRACDRARYHRRVAERSATIGSV